MFQKILNKLRKTVTPSRESLLYPTKGGVTSISHQSVLNRTFQLWPIDLDPIGIEIALDKLDASKDVSDESKQDKK